MTDDTTGTETARETCGATTESGTPCQKGADHGGGHWFMSDDQYACLRAEHYDPLAVLSLQPLVHLDVPCPRNAPTAPTEARGLGERVELLEALEAAVTRWSNIADNRERMDRDDAGAWAFRCAIEDVRAAGMRETGGKG